MAVDSGLMKRDDEEPTARSELRAAKVKLVQKGIRERDPHLKWRLPSPKEKNLREIRRRFWLRCLKQ